MIKLRFLFYFFNLIKYEWLKMSDEIEIDWTYEDKLVLLFVLFGIILIGLKMLGVI